MSGTHCFMNSTLQSPYLIVIRTRAEVLDVPTPVVDALIDLLTAIDEVAVTAVCWRSMPCRGPATERKARRPPSTPSSPTAPTRSCLPPLRVPCAPHDTSPNAVAHASCGGGKAPRPLSFSTFDADLQLLASVLAGRPEAAAADARTLLPAMWVFAYVFPLTVPPEERKADAMDVRLSVLVCSTDVCVTPEDVLSVLAEGTLGAPVDIVAEVFPAKAELDTMLDALPPAASLAVLHPHLPLRPPSDPRTLHWRYDLSVYTAAPAQPSTWAPTRAIASRPPSLLPIGNFGSPPPQIPPLTEQFCARRSQARLPLPTVSPRRIVSSSVGDEESKEVNIWRELKHPNVLELYGASGASGDRGGGKEWKGRRSRLFGPSVLEAQPRQDWPLLPHRQPHLDDRFLFHIDDWLPDTLAPILLHFTMHGVHQLPSA
ncbi:hypothetical protein B0H13DRAFT_2385230 [Mycena leptocephala]|nr:hypothetical protein B0H13DRAFT_2385230 [Mycena leptocephala]